MKIVCKIRAFFNGEIIKPGQIVDFKGKEIPCWAKPLNSKADAEKENTPENPSTQQPTQTGDKVPEENTPEKEQVNPQTAQELANKNESELNVILEELRTQALEKNIVVDAENKTVIEQINELKIKLDEVNK